jgi:hypothetical protein
MSDKVDFWTSQNFRAFKRHRSGSVRCGADSPRPHWTEKRKAVSMARLFKSPKKLLV